MDDCRELVDSVAAENSIVRVHEIDNVKGYDFRPHGGILAEGHVDINLSQRLNSLVAEAVKRVLRVGAECGPDTNQ
jgi:hypothetical protein